MWFVRELSRFSVGQIVLSLTCSFTEKPHTGLDEYLNMLLWCFRKRMSALLLIDNLLPGENAAAKTKEASPPHESIGAGPEVIRQCISF